ncbi:MAG TPA: hypothetical protein VK870_14400, partial [Ignavibacteriaceae bacterium]|nr:hypothetical protein [Ignavibacteriaceae bacterium]
MKNSLIKTETELKKRLIYSYKWGRKQNDQFDNETNFIYHISSFEDLLKEIETKFKTGDNYQDYFNYAL